MAKPRRVFRLSEHEAQVLQNIFGAIGGQPGYVAFPSSRATTDVLSARLTRTFGRLPRISHSGSIHFLDSLQETLRNGAR